jgi:poly-gamma-glutamate synthesis protein (capsule biosynthesis protein)
MKRKPHIAAMMVIIIAVVVSLNSKSSNTVSYPKVEKKYPSVLNFGDVMFDRGVRNIMEKRGRDLFEYIKQDKGVIRGYDVVIANLEGPIVEMDRKKCQQKAYNFQFAYDTPARLKDVGITMVNIANNHAFDCFRVGFKSTKAQLTQAGIDYIGDADVEKSFVVKNIDGKKIAFVGMDETVQAIPLLGFYPLVKKLAGETDYIVVHIHWGTEYSPVATDVQKNIAHKLIDNGVDVIIGHHPHVIEPVEIYKGKAIFYSLGNFVFDQTDAVTKDGLGVGVSFEDTKTVFALYPYHLEAFAPKFLENKERNIFCRKYLEGLPHKDCSFELE